MISHKHRFIFIHIPKTAGTSIEQALRDETCQLLPNEWDHARVPHAPLNHLTLQELVDYGVLTPAQLKSYCKFGFVRNPWDRLVSEISCPWMSPWFNDLPVDQRIRRACELAATPIGIANHLRPQHDFMIAEGLEMDFIGRFEHLEEDFGRLCRLLGIDASLPHLNRSSHRPYQAYYDAETQALAATTYRRDIDAFHYQFGETSSNRDPVREAPRPVETHARKITAHPLVDQPAPLQPAADEVASSASVDVQLSGANQPGWNLLCPVTFTAIWNGGPRPEDIEIHREGASPDQPAFVQSYLGKGVLTFYPGYQFKTNGDHLLWLRGPINTPKDGLAPLESLVDASLLPCAVTMHWQFTRPHQTVRFEAGEPFATLLLYPKTSLDAMRVEMMQYVNDADAHERTFRQTVDDPAVHHPFQNQVTSHPHAAGSFGRMRL